MESLLTVMGLLFFMFLVLAAAVEVILEVFRGTLGVLGFTWVKGTVSLDEALKLADEFAPDGGELHTKLEAVKASSEQLGDVLKDKVAILQEIKEDLKNVTEQEKGVIAGRLNAVAAAVNEKLDQHKRNRIFILRSIAAVVGCFLVYETKFYVFVELTKAPGAEDILVGLATLEAVWVNVLVGGLAAAAGSSYWHDKLDKVRSLKSAVQDAKKLTA